jgi:hypothetical protein
MNAKADLDVNGPEHRQPILGRAMLTNPMWPMLISLP